MIADVEPVTKQLYKKNFFLGFIIHLVLSKRFNVRACVLRERSFIGEYPDSVACNVKIIKIKKWYHYVGPLMS